MLSDFKRSGFALRWVKVQITRGHLWWVSWSTLHGKYLALHKRQLSMHNSGASPLLLKPESTLSLLGKSHPDMVDPLTTRQFIRVYLCPWEFAIFTTHKSISLFFVFRSWTDLGEEAGQTGHTLYSFLQPSARLESAAHRQNEPAYVQWVRGQDKFWELQT